MIEIYGFRDDDRGLGATMTQQSLKNTVETQTNRITGKTGWVGNLKRAELWE